MRPNMERRLRDRLAELRPVIGSVSVDRESAVAEVKLIHKLLDLPDRNRPEIALESWRRKFIESVANDPSGPNVTIVDKDGQKWSVDDSLLSVVDRLLKFIDDPGAESPPRENLQQRPGPGYESMPALPEMPRCSECGALLEGGARGLCFACRGRPKPYQQTIHQRLNRRGRD